MKTKKRQVIESGPSVKYQDYQNGEDIEEKRGQCDSLLCEDGVPIGVVEVEGTQYMHAINKIELFLRGGYQEIRQINFGILFLYATTPTGRGKNRRFYIEPNVEKLEKSSSTILLHINKITKTYQDKFIIVVALIKKFVRNQMGIFSKNDFYKGVPVSIQLFLYKNGCCIKEKEIPLYT